MSSRKLWYVLTLLAFVMLPLAGCGGTSGTKAVSEGGYTLNVSGKVAGGKSLFKTLFAAATDLGTLTVINAQDGAILGTGAIDATGAFSNVAITLPAAKTVLVFKAEVSIAGGPFRAIVPIDLSNPPTAGISVSNGINIQISQATTDVAKTVSAMLGVTGVLGDSGATLASVSKTYADAADQVVKNGGQVLAYNTSGLVALTGQVSSASMLPARDVSTLTFDDLQNIALDGKIISAFIPGNNPIVNFTVVNKANGKGITGLRNFSLHIAQLQPELNGSNSIWSNYIAAGLPLTAIPAYTERGASAQTAPVNPSADAVSVFNSNGTVKAQGFTVIDHGDGTYTATFGANIKANPSVVYDGTLTHRIGVGVRTVSVPGVVGKTPGAYAGPVNPLTGAAISAFTNINGAALIYDFVPSTGAALADASGNRIFARDIVTIAACNQCHYKLEYGTNNTSGHFGSRPDTKLCVMCHTPQLASGEGDFTNFMHKIHMGEELPTAATDKPVGIDVSEFKFPMDQRNCTICHKGADVSNWMTKPSIKSCGSCHTNINFATGANSIATGTAHAAQASDQYCAGCHTGATAQYEVSAMHVTNVSTPNNLTTPAGLANFTYAISSVVVNASSQAEITFQIKKDGAAVTFNTYDAAVSGLVPITGFSGGPSLYIVYSVPQDGITSPADFNASSSVSLTNLWNGTQGTLVESPVGTYKATLVGTASAPVALPASAKMVTGSIIGSFTQTSPAAVRPALQVSKVATGFTARRTIVSNALCNKCHEQLGIKPSFHSGARNEAAGCAYCHTPNRTSSGWSAGSSNFVHAIHAAGKRSTQFNWQSSLQYWTVGYPGVLKNCEACHVTGSYDFSATANAAAVPNLLPIAVATAGSWVTNTTTAVRPATTPATFYAIGDIRPNQTDGSLVFLLDASSSPYVSAANYGPGFTFVPATGVTYPASGDNLVNSPISSACFSCHDTNAAKAHMVLNGGSIYEKRSVELTKTETCLTCHGGISSTNAFNQTAPNIKAVHRWW